MKGTTAGWNFTAQYQRFTQPFPHVIFEHFLSKEKTHELQHALLNEPFRELNTDLYHFYQCSDLKNTRTPLLHHFYADFSNMKGVVQKIFATSPLASIDMSGFCYAEGHYLLPHDDRLEGRKIAYILYLSTCKKDDGGTLDLFSAKKVKGELVPIKIVKSITPTAGKLVLFEVSKRSFHQVSEQLQGKRYTLAGWFHG